MLLLGYSEGAKQEMIQRHFQAVQAGRFASKNFDFVNKPVNTFLSF